MDPIPFLIYAFTSVFTIVNPISGMITFISLTEGMGAAERKKVAKRSVIIACILAIIFALVGELILRFYNVTVDALRVAGGILLFIVALNMLQARSSKVTQAELKDADQREDISVFPVA
ncbi:MAG: NAAT family transporter, partial [Halobacteriota archaeon]|nr:NAAT family transporter [Halobacteriota archaeon]